VPEAVLLTYDEFEDLGGEAKRTYSTEPQPHSVPFSLDQWAEGDPFTQQILDEIRAEEGLPPPGR
jgi:hypothetical protein